MLNFHVISLFPETIEAYLQESILKRAIQDKKITVQFYNPQNWAEQSNNPALKKPLDDKPFGGGPGMVLKAKPFLQTIKKAIGKKTKYKIIYFSPRGENFDTKTAKKIALENKQHKIQDLILVAGRYEGIDSRIEEIYPGERISIGDYVLTGGEIPAMILIDSISRQIPGVLGNFNSLEEERISSGKFYTRPEIIKWPLRKGKEYSVPKVLLSGNHQKIKEWKKNN